MTGRVFRALAPLAFALLLFAAGMVLAASYARAAPAGRTHVAFFCGLLTGNGCSLTQIAALAAARGWSVSVHAHWADPVEVARRVGARRFALVGHSAGADRVLARAAAARARIVVAIDPTIANRGAAGGVPVYSFYNPLNRLVSDGLPVGILTFGTCCGGAYVAGAHNEIVRRGHLAMPRDPALQARIVELIARVAR